MRRFGYPWRALATGALLVGLAAVPPAAVLAATDTVTNCNSDDGSTSGTLRYEINNAAAGDTVTFSCSGTITLGGTIALSKDVKIDANGAPGPVTISGGSTPSAFGVQVFSVGNGMRVTLNGLTIANAESSGSAANHTTAQGGGILNNGQLTVTNTTFSGNSADAGQGGGIYNNGTLSVTNSTFSGNSASHGGGIYNNNALTVTNSTFSGNSAGTAGGGIYNNSALTVTNSTFSGNSAGAGGGIYNVGTLTLTNGTFSGNSAGAGGGIYNFGTSATLANTILANSTDGDCTAANPSALITDNGGNLADDTSCGFSQSSSKNNATGLNLGSLASNGGPTQTIALGAGSSAIDFTSTNCPSTDQRGVARPDNGEAKCDAGAYEFQDPDTSAPKASPAPSPAANAAGWNNSDVTVNWNWADSDGPSDIDLNNCTTSSTSSGEGSNLPLAATCKDKAGNIGNASYMVKVDKTAPSITAAATTQPTSNGWYNGSKVTVHFTCGDALSGVESCPADQVLSTEGSAVSSTAQTAVDAAGNTSGPSNVVTVKIDKTAPVVTVGGVADKGSYLLGNVPTASCTTADSLSGVATNAHIQITGGTPSGVGSFTASCSGATDNAGNTAPPVSATYSVNYAFSGFMAPVNNPNTVNTGKAGRTYPIKFQLTNASGGFISNLSAVKSITYQTTNCATLASDPSDPLETTSTGSAGLQYDSTANQFIYTWATPSATGCYTLLVTLDSGQVYPAYFNLS
jgi:hypothetical protein